MPVIKLNSARFQGFSFSNGPKRGEGGSVVVADFAAPWTDANREAGGWEEIPETVSGSIKLLPLEIPCKKVNFKPGAGLQMHEFEVEVTEAGDFHVFVPTKDDEERELRFKIRSSAKNAYAIFGKYGQAAGEAKGTLKLYPSGEEQETLPEAQSTIEEK